MLLDAYLDWWAGLMNFTISPTIELSAGSAFRPCQRAMGSWSDSSTVPGLFLQLLLSQSFEAVCDCRLFGLP
jgi:hypothetical protein